MVNLIKRMATVSVALILLCLGVVAQNENSTKSFTNEEYGVVVPSLVEMTSGEVRILTITPLQGYDNPFLIYGNNINSVVERESFSAIIYKDKLSGAYFLEITAKDVNETKNDVIFVRAMQKYPEFGVNSRTNEDPGVRVTIIVNPKEMK